MNPEPDFNAQLEERFGELPKVVQDAIVSADIEQHLRQLAEHHKLHLDQWESLENEVMLALLGFRPAEALARNIEEAVHVDSIVAAALASDISAIVFQPIRQELERQLSHPDAVAKETTGVEDLRTSVLADEAKAASGETPPTESADAAVVAPAAEPPHPTQPAPISAGTPSEANPVNEGAIPNASLLGFEGTLVASTVAPPAPATAVSATPASPAAAPVLPATPPAPTPDQKVERVSVADSYAKTASHERKAIVGDPYREQIQ